VAGTTDGNAVVLFRKSDVVSAGDLFDLTGYPMIDMRAGGGISARVDVANTGGRAGDAVVQLGVPLERALDIIEQVGRHADSVAETFVKLFMDSVWKPIAHGGEPGAEWSEARAALERLRPLVTDTLVAVFQRRMTQAVERAFGRELERRPRR
jgi:hypothetical protein